MRPLLSPLWMGEYLKYILGMEVESRWVLRNLSDSSMEVLNFSPLLEIMTHRPTYQRTDDGPINHLTNRPTWWLTGKLKFKEYLPCLAKEIKDKYQIVNNTF